MDGFDVPVFEKSRGIDIRTLKFDIVPCMVVEEDYFYVLVFGIDRIYRAHQHHYGIRFILDLVHLMAEIEGIGLLRGCGTHGICKKYKEGDYYLLHVWFRL